MTIPGHKSYTKTERCAKSEDYFQKQLQKRRIDMLDESKSNLFEEYEQMVNARIDELNNKGFGATNKFREARNIHQIIRYFIESQPEVDEETEIHWVEVCRLIANLPEIAPNDETWQELRKWLQEEIKISNQPKKADVRIKED